jgi:ABC-type nitrate/sulfonate/bicarbonate transport system ATPase subunit
MAEKILKVENLNKTYQDKVGFRINLFKNLSLDIEENSFTSVIAPEGAGKSSLLKIISGLEDPTDGNIEKPAELDKVVFVPSEPSSYPWFNVTDNIYFASPKLKTERMDNIINLVGLKGYESHFPHNKSLGFRFRISLARALSLNPSLILLDEPFKKMEPRTKLEIYLLLLELVKSGATSFLLATTNISEALFLSQKVFLMKKQPGEILDKYNVIFESERNETLFGKDEFQNMRSQTEAVFRKSQTRHLFNFSI